MGGEAEVEIPAPARTMTLRVVGWASSAATPARVAPCGDGKKRFLMAASLGVVLEPELEPEPEPELEGLESFETGICGDALKKEQFGYVTRESHRHRSCFPALSSTTLFVCQTRVP